MVKVLLFDAGHGVNTYPESGSKGVPEMAEFEFNSAVVGYAKELAERNGFKVILSQPLDGRDVYIFDRTNMARDEKCDLLMSFHADANPNRDANGHWCFYWYTDNQSKKLAQIWDKIATEILPNPSRGYLESKTGTWTNFHMCREPVKYGIPSILIEHAFMTNREDLNLLLSDDFRRKCAEVAVRAVCEFLGIEYKEYEEDDKLKFEHDYQWEMLTAILNEFYQKSVSGEIYPPLLSDYAWVEKVYSRTLTNSELNFLNTVFIARSQGLKV